MPESLADASGLTKAVILGLYLHSDSWHANDHRPIARYAEYKTPSCMYMHTISHCPRSISNSNAAQMQ